MISYIAASRSEREPYAGSSDGGHVRTWAQLLLPLHPAQVIMSIIFKFRNTLFVVTHTAWPVMVYELPGQMVRDASSS